jgi:hypothetical protein
MSGEGNGLDAPTLVPDFSGSARTTWNTQWPSGGGAVISVTEPIVRTNTSLRGWPVRALAMASALLLGAVIGHWAWPRDARAQSGSSPATVYVPAEGMIFRTLDGHPIARLARDANGSVIELYDGEDQPMTRLGASLSAIPGRAPEGAPSANPRKPSFTIDNDDPWTRRN